MTATRIDGKAFALALRERVAVGVAGFWAATGRAPGLSVVLVGDEGPSAVYVAAKEKACAEAGMRGAVHRLPADVTQDALLQRVADLPPSLLMLFGRGAAQRVQVSTKSFPPVSLAREPVHVRRC